MDKKLDNLRHSAAHLLAAAVVELWPKALPTIGPVIEEGFYYDFDNLKISEEDLPKIEKKMREIFPSWKSFEKIEISASEAKKRFKDNPYKIELIDELTLNHEPLTIYKSGDFVDLCRGGHSDKPSEELKHFHLLSIAGAYWRGSEKNKMLTRIYGTAFFSAKELEEYISKQEEALKRDHRVIGKNLNLFVFSDLIGKGLPLFTENGATIRRELERFIQDEEIKRGYKHVITPVLAKTDLYRTSGHYPYYKDTMYPPMVIDNEELILRPMTCPHHFMLYKSAKRSYRELPLRYAELSPQFRYEKSGELTGLSRVRTFCLADAHIFCTTDQARAVIKEVLDLINDANGTLGFLKGDDYRFRLSLGDRGDEKKYYKDDVAWDKAESILREVLKETNAPYFEAEGEAAFYGPKIDVQMKRVSGQEETAFTVQYDFVMPKRFDLSFVNERGEEKEPVVIHRASIGAIERTMAFLIEKYEGNFPIWLSPTQVAILPITDKNLEYAKSITKSLDEEGIRVELNENNDTLQAKIRDAQLSKIPYMLIIGGKEEEAGKVAVRSRDGKDLGQMELKTLVEKLLNKIKAKELDLALN